MFLPARIVVIIATLYAHFVRHQINPVEKTKVWICKQAHSEEEPVGTEIHIEQLITI